MKKAVQIAIGTGLTLPLLTGTVDAAAQGMPSTPTTSVVGVSQFNGGVGMQSQNPNFPRNAPAESNHVIIFDDGSWVTVDDMTTPPTGATVGWRHEPRVLGTPAPWERQTGQQVANGPNQQANNNQVNQGQVQSQANLVRISDVFPASENIEPSNGVFAGIAREFAGEALTRQVPSANIDIGRTLSAQEQQTSDNLVRQFVESFDIESGTGALGVNEDGFAVKMDGITIRTYTAEEGAQLGGWDASTRTAWVATHIRQADGRVVPRTIEEISNVLLYEVFGRSNGFGMTLSVLMTEVLNGETEPSSPGSDLFRYTGLYHQIGAENVLAMAKQLDEEQFQDWMNIQIRELNPNFSFDYAQMQMLRASAGAAARSENARTQFAGQMGMPANQVRNQLEGIWNHFYSATDPNVSANVGSNAARQFNDFVRRGAGVSLSNDSFHPGWEVDYNGRLMSLLDINSPMLDLNNPQIGVHSQIMFGEGIRQRRTPGSVIPGAANSLAEIGRQVQAGYTIQDGEWVQGHLAQGAPQIRNQNLIFPPAASAGIALPVTAMLPQTESGIVVPLSAIAPQTESGIALPQSALMPQTDSGIALPPSAVGFAGVGLVANRLTSINAQSFNQSRLVQAESANEEDWSLARLIEDDQMQQL